VYVAEQRSHDGGVERKPSPDWHAWKGPIRKASEVRPPASLRVRRAREEHVETHPGVTMYCTKEVRHVWTWMITQE
jgi:hypothetical protein